jgi:hypothetical protein
VNWDIAIALKHDLIWVSSDAPMISSSVTVLLSISSPSSAYHKGCCQGRPIRLIFCRSFSSLSTHLAPTFRNFSHASCSMLHCLSLSSRLLESTLPPAAHLLLSQSQQGDLVGHHLRLSNVLEGISQPSYEPLYATNTSHRKQETFLNEYPLPTENERSPFWLLKPAS